MFHSPDLAINLVFAYMIDSREYCYCDGMLLDNKCHVWFSIQSVYWLTVITPDCQLCITWSNYVSTMYIPQI